MSKHVFKFMFEELLELSFCDTGNFWLLYRWVGPQSGSVVETSGDTFDSFSLTQGFISSVAAKHVTQAGRNSESYWTFRKSILLINSKRHTRNYPSNTKATNNLQCSLGFSVENIYCCEQKVLKYDIVPFCNTFPKIGPIQNFSKGALVV